MSVNRRWFSLVSSVVLSTGLGLSGLALAQATEGPDALIKRLFIEMLDTFKADKNSQSGNTSKVRALVDSKIMPNVNLVLTYAGAWTEVRDKTF